MTEEEKAAQKARPVATNPIPGTPWYASHRTHTDVITSRCDKKSNALYSLLWSGVSYGREMIAFFFTTQRHDCPCGTGPTSWSAALTSTNTFRSPRTRKAQRITRRRVRTSILLDTERNTFDCFIYGACFVCAVVNKEVPEISIATEDNQDEEPTKAKKRK